MSNITKLSQNNRTLLETTNPVRITNISQSTVSGSCETSASIKTK